MSCPVSAPKGHKGALTVIGTKAVFVDLTARDVHALSDDGFGERTGLGEVDVPDNALVAGNDLDGRVAIVDPGKGVVHLVDVGTQPAAPITRPIRPGTYDKVASSGQGLALLDRKNADLVPLGRDGKETSHQKVASRQRDDEEKREPNLFRGDDSRVYVESSKGDRGVVVDREGNAETVELSTDGQDNREKPAKPIQTPTRTPPPAKTPSPVKTPPPPVKTETPEPPDRTTTPPGGDRRTPGKTRTTPPRKTTRPRSTPTNQATAKAGRPGAPVGVRARAGDGSATVTWQAATPNGAAITSYKLSWSGGSTTVAGTARSATITGLADTTGYYITVQAVNRIGVGPAVRSNRVELKWTVAESPRELLVKSDGVSGTLVLAWDTPDMKDGTLLNYAVTMGSQTKTTTAQQITWSGLTNGKNYTFVVRAVTRAPDGLELTGWPASLTAAPVGAPQRTKRVVASRGAGAEYKECQPPACAFVQVRIENLRPNTDYEIKPWTSK
ncbi:fibronectin type III domain-containing protein [Kribbella sp. NPDC049174]|uniref:fibronectin type III domain-containing protein n=1 Tax=Kribbella sp. NPDC049174 TaxID=3364112 RepID=UPI00371B161B